MLFLLSLLTTQCVFAGFCCCCVFWFFHLPLHSCFMPNKHDSSNCYHKNRIEHKYTYEKWVDSGLWLNADCMHIGNILFFILFFAARLKQHYFFRLLSNFGVLQIYFIDTTNKNSIRYEFGWGVQMRLFPLKWRRYECRYECFIMTVTLFFFPFMLKQRTLSKAIDKITFKSTTVNKVRPRKLTDICRIDRKYFCWRELNIIHTNTMKRTQ